jgi:hypothetical protein
MLNPATIKSGSVLLWAIWKLVVVEVTVKVNVAQSPVPAWLARSAMPELPEAVASDLHKAQTLVGWVDITPDTHIKNEPNLGKLGILVAVVDMGIWK